MLIRRMTIDDIPLVAEIEKQCFSLPWSEKSFADSLVRADTIFLVCEDECDADQKSNTGTSEVAGYIGMYLSFEEASITNVAVAPRLRKRGCAKLLVEQAKKAAKDAGATHILLEVRISNEPAISLYKKQGFEELGVRKRFYEHPVEDAIIMKVGI